MDEELLGRWEQMQGQPYPGLWFEFKSNGTYQANLEEMGIISSGTYTTEGNKIDMDQTEHTLGATGEFRGLYAIEDDILRMAVSSPSRERPTDLSDARMYKRVEK
ncbi:MAG: hypothetical protein ACP5GX_09635 [Anaerolineae bacterium]